MIDNTFRNILPKFSGPILRIFKVLGLSPNQITFIGFICSLASAFLITIHFNILAILTWWFGRLLDGTDGVYARETKQTSSFGAFLDIFLDMASYSIMILGFSFAFYAQHLQWLLILFLYVLCITGALALGSLEDKNKLPNRDNRGLRLAAGIAEGGETGIAYTLFLLFPSHIEWLTWVWIFVLGITVVARAFIAKSELIKK